MAPNDGLPPTIAATARAGPSRIDIRPAARAANAESADQNANLDASETQDAATNESLAALRPSRAKSTRASAKKRKATNEGTDADLGGEVAPEADQAETSTAPRRKSKKKAVATADETAGESQTVVRRPARVRRRAFLGFEEGGEANFQITRKRVSYTSRGKQGTSGDKRLRANKQKEKQEQLSIPRNIPMLEAAEAGQHVGQRVDDHSLTMGALATYATSGRVSERGIRLQEHQKERKTGIERERPKRIEDAWRRKQVQRRKIRAERNTERARRRSEFEEMGTSGHDIVSDDEEDSEEEYAVRPEWLKNLDDEEDIRRGRQQRDTPPGEGEDEDGLENDNGADDELAVDEDGLMADEDAHDAALRASGFIVTRDEPRDAADINGEEDEDENRDDDAVQEEDWENGDGLDYDVDAYRQEVEERRRRNIERAIGQGVIEENTDLVMINSSTYARKQKSEKWTNEDNELFYVVSRAATPSGVFN